MSLATRGNPYESLEVSASLSTQVHGGRTTSVSHISNRNSNRRILSYSCVSLNLSNQSVCGFNRWFYNVVGDFRCPVSDTWWQTETGGFMVITPLRHNESRITEINMCYFNRPKPFFCGVGRSLLYQVLGLRSPVQPLSLSLGFRYVLLILFFVKSIEAV